MRIGRGHRRRSPHRLLIKDQDAVSACTAEARASTAFNSRQKPALQKWFADAYVLTLAELQVLTQTVEQELVIKAALME